MTGPTTPRTFNELSCAFQRLDQSEHTAAAAASRTRKLRKDVRHQVVGEQDIFAAPLGKAVRAR